MTHLEMNPEYYFDDPSRHFPPKNRENRFAARIEGLLYAIDSVYGNARLTDQERLNRLQRIAGDLLPFLNSAIEGIILPHPLKDTESMLVARQTKRQGESLSVISLAELQELSRMISPAIEMPPYPIGNTPLRVSNEA